MKKRLISLITLISILLSLGITGFAETESLYYSDNIRQYVKSMKEIGIYDMFANELIFGEESPVKRHEAAKALVDYFGYSAMTSMDVSQTYFDVPSYYEHKAAISAAVSMGIMKGTAENLFAPEDNILAGHFLKAFIETLGYGWKAQVKGGYPTGYITTAAELGLLGSYGVSAETELTRGALVETPS